MRNPFRRRRPIRTANEATALRCIILLAKASALQAVTSSRALGVDDLLIIEYAHQALDQMRGEEQDPRALRGARIFAREISRLVHANPIEGEPL